MKISEQTKNILNYIHDGIIIVDNTSKIRYINKAYSRILGVEAYKIEGKYLRNVEPDAKLLKVIKDEKPICNKKVHISSLNKDVMVNITPLYNEGKLIGGLSVFKDITEMLEISRKLRKTKEINKYLREKNNNSFTLPDSFKNVIGRAPNFLKVLNKSAKAAKTKVPILLRGENGTGKGILAKAIHDASTRKNNKFVQVNCAAIPENLLESELFGYEKGSFTGANQEGKQGKFEKADGGTIFLDEIGDMSMSMQAKILKAVEEQRFFKVGGSELINVNVRILAATNKRLEKLINKNHFRKDLYYRLNVVPLYLPPLRERKDDIYLLVDHFINNLEENIEISEDALNLLIKYDWPGNIRELKNVVKYASVMAKNNKITKNDLPEEKFKMEEHNDYKETLDNSDMKTILENCEIDLIKKALNKAGNNRTKAIDILGISRRTFYKKLKKYNLY